jgi:hypothetical protein
VVDVWRKQRYVRILDRYKDIRMNVKEACIRGSAVVEMIGIGQLEHEADLWAEGKTF